jgi:hypothetical protein
VAPISAGFLPRFYCAVPHSLIVGAILVGKGNGLMSPLPADLPSGISILVLESLVPVALELWVLRTGVVFAGRAWGMNNPGVGAFAPTGRPSLWGVGPLHTWENACSVSGLRPCDW